MIPEYCSDNQISWLLFFFFSQDESVKKTAQLMYQTALMESGFMLSDPKDFASRIYSSVKSSLNISPEAAVEEEEETEEVETETETKSADKAEDDAEYVKDEL